MYDVETEADAGGALSDLAGPWRGEVVSWLGLFGGRGPVAERDDLEAMGRLVTDGDSCLHEVLGLVALGGERQGVFKLRRYGPWQSALHGGGVDRKENITCSCFCELDGAQESRPSPFCWNKSARDPRWQKAHLLPLAGESCCRRLPFDIGLGPEPAVRLL
jgi:hypothetical protein